MAAANVANTLVVPEATRNRPFYDDFDESKNFHKIVFRPGYAVQARELTQIQTILQNQVERFGRHIFVNGSSVIGGQIYFKDIISLNVAPEFSNNAVDVEDFVGKTIQYSSGNNTILALCVTATPATANDPPTIYLNYTGGKEFVPGDSIKVKNENVFAQIAATANSKANSFYAYINDSIYFYNGYFVKVPKQAIVVAKYHTNANAKVGLELDDSIVTETTDTSLLDPALEASNFQAPGAARYKAELVLAKRDLDSTDDEAFVEISRLENGVLKKNTTIPVYSEIEEVFARRTYDESGNYTVRPFVVSLEEDVSGDSANNLIISLSAGKAYIYGFEYETISETKMRIPKARTYANVGNYNLIANYGNYVIVNELHGAFDTTGMGITDIHCVPHWNVATSNTTLYNSTKIGRGRIKDIEFFSGDTSVEDRRFEFYIFDTNFNKLYGNCHATAANTRLMNLQTVIFSTNADAYVGATVRVHAGNAAGEARTIVAYDGATRSALVDSPFSVTTNASSNISIEFDFRQAESFFRSSVYTPGAAANSNCNITILNKEGGALNGAAYITEPSLSPLLFNYPNKYITPGTISDVSYMYRRVFTGVQFTSGTSATLTAASDEGFEAGTSSSNVSSTMMDNFLVVVTNPQSSGRSLHDQIKVTATVTGGSPEQATLETAGGASDTFVATVYSKMDIAGSAATKRVKTLVTANTTAFPTGSPSNTFFASTGSMANVYLTRGQVVITSPSRRPNEKESLYISDVVTVKKIYDLAGAAEPAAGSSLSGFTDVTSRFIVDNGQRDSHYDHASIALKPGHLPCIGPLVVCTRYYSTTSDSGYFSVDSYPDLSVNVVEEGVTLGTGYAIIPTYKNTNLRDCIDFRPVRASNSNTAPHYTLSGVRIPVPATDFTSDFSYYMGRYDAVLLNANRTLSLIQGDPSTKPQYPTTPSKSMVLNMLFVPPYTEYPVNVKVRYADTHRYTMRDIGNIDKRVKNLEYYVALNNLEKNALDMTVPDVDGLDRSKYSIFVDGFTGHLLGDVNSDDYKIAVDVNGRFTGDGMAIPQYLYGTVPLEVTGTEDVFVGLDRILLDFTEEEFLSQTSATKFTPVADFLYASFEGTVFMSPEADVWRDISNAQIVNITNITNEFYRTEYNYEGYTEQESLAWAIGEVRRVAVEGMEARNADGLFKSTAIQNMTDAQIAANLQRSSWMGTDWIAPFWFDLNTNEFTFL